ncbi:hypothetical protein, partial [Limnospira sp.]|uniref:hypothetical protein n=1 Tax=Limnospira sp. TaxID=3100384 RepID=UPI003F718378
HFQLVLVDVVLSLSQSRYLLGMALSIISDYTPMVDFLGAGYTSDFYSCIWVGVYRRRLYHF